MHCCIWGTTGATSDMAKWCLLCNLPYLVATAEETRRFCICSSAFRVVKKGSVTLKRYFVNEFLWLSIHWYHLKFLKLNWLLRLIIYNVEL